MNVSWIKATLSLAAVCANLEVSGMVFSVNFGGGGGPRFGIASMDRSFGRTLEREQRQIARAMSRTPMVDVPKPKVSPIVPLAVAGIGALVSKNASLTVQLGNNPGIHATAGRKGKRVEAFASLEDKPAPKIVPSIDVDKAKEEEERLRRKLEEVERVRASFTNWSSDTVYDTVRVGKEEYHRAKDSKSEFLSLGCGRGWENFTDPYNFPIGFSHFPNQPKNLRFEKTNLIWHFDTVSIDNRLYNHAWTDTLVDFMVPKDEKGTHTIFAPEWYVKQCLKEQELSKKRAEKAESEAKARKLEEDKRSQSQIVDKSLDKPSPKSSQPKSLGKSSSESFAKGYITEALWGSISAAREISLGRDSRAGSAAEVALSYCEKAADILHEMGCTALDAVEDLFVVGGAGNLRAYLSHKITKQEYYDKIVEDLTLDTGMAVLGGIIGAVGGGIGGAEVGVVGGPVGVVTGASKGVALEATKGAAAGYVAVRAARAAVNATVNLFKGGSRSGGDKEEPDKKERKTEEVRKSGGNGGNNGKNDSPVARTRDVVQKDRTPARSGTSGYGTGKHWESIKPVNTSEATQKIGHINKQAFGGGEIRTDGELIYRFDRGHKTGKIHLERYRKVGSNKWQGFGEVDPETSKILEGSIERTAERVIKW